MRRSCERALGNVANLACVIVSPAALGESRRRLCDHATVFPPCAHLTIRMCFLQACGNWERVVCVIGIALFGAKDEPIGNRRLVLRCQRWSRSQCLGVSASAPPPAPVLYRGVNSNGGGAGGPMDGNNRRIRGARSVEVDALPASSSALPAPSPSASPSKVVE